MADLVTARSSLSDRLRRNDVLRDGMLIFAATMISNAFAFLLHFFASRWLGPANYGAFSSMLALVVIVAVISTIGLTIVTTTSAGYYASGDYAAIRSFRAQTFRVVAYCAGGATLAVAVLSVPIAHFLDVKVASILTTAIALGLAIATPPIRGLLQGTHRFGALSISLFLDAVVRFAAALALIAFGFGAAGAMAGLAVGSGVSLLYTAFAVRDFGTADAGDRHAIADFGRSVTAIGTVIFCITALSSYDVLFARHFFTPAEAGEYSAVALVGRAIFLVVSFLPTVLLPKAASRASIGLSSRMLLVRCLTTLIVFGAVAIGICAAMPARVLGVLAGAAYVGAAPLVVPYALATTFLSAANVIATYQIGHGRRSFVRFLAAALVLEACAIALRHPSPSVVVWTIMVGHLLALLASTVGLGSWRRSAAAPHT